MSNLDLTFADIVRTRLAELGLKPSAVERKAGLAPDTIRNVLRSSSNSGPHFTTARQIADALGLEFYVGPSRAARPEASGSNREDIAFVALHNVQASAGPGRFALDDEIVSSLGFPLPWLSRHGVNPDRASLIFVEGDSMSPTIRSGSVALVNHNRRKVNSKKVYAFRDGDGLFVKRLEMVDDETLFVTSDNPDHASRVIKNHDLENISIIGEVVWTGRSWLGSDKT